MSPSASCSLELALSFSAGVSSLLVRDKIVQAYSSLVHFAEKVEAIESDLMTTRATPRVQQLSHFNNILRDVGSRVVIASTYYGHPLSLACAGAEGGAALTVLHHGASEDYKGILSRRGIELVDTREIASAGRLYRELDATVLKGRIPVIPFDAPHPSRLSWPFLGYRAEVSTLIAAYAKRRKLGLLPVITHLDDDGELSWKTFNLIEDPSVAHIGQLLGYLEDEVKIDPLQYRWNSHTCIFSDERAKQNALAFLTLALEWREAYFGGHSQC